MFKIGDRVLLPAQVIEIISNNIVVVNILSKADMTVDTSTILREKDMTVKQVQNA